MRSSRPPFVRLALAGLGLLFLVGWLASLGAVLAWERHDQSRPGRGDRGAGRGAVRRPSVARAASAAGPCGGAVAPRTGADDDRDGRNRAGGHDERGGGEPALRRHSAACRSRAILLETEGRTTSESMAGVAALMAKSGPPRRIAGERSLPHAPAHDPGAASRAHPLRVPDADQPHRRQPDRAVEVRIERVRESPAGLHLREERPVNPRDIW